MGGEPAVRCRSEASFSITCSRTSAKSKSIIPPYRQGHRSRDPCELADGRDPGLDLLEAVEAQWPHALLHRDLADLVRGRTLDRERADLVTHLHHLVDADAALVAGASAAAAADGHVRLDVERNVETRGLQRRHAHHRALLAVVAERAHETLGDHADDGGGAQERLHLHLR